MRAIFVAGLLIAATVPVEAADMRLQSMDGAVTFTGSYGLTAIRAGEFVYAGSKKLSELDWKSNAVSTLNAGVSVELPRDFYLKATGLIGFGGDGFMADFDWQNPQRSAWSDRSQHPDTRLDHYYVVSAEVGRVLVSRDATELGMGAGFKYTDVQWSAWGGSYVYSSGGFRNLRGRFDPDQKGISYRQSWPVPYLGATLRHSDGNWTFSGALQGGLAVGASDIDDHWARNLRFYDDFNATPVVALSAMVDYRVLEHVSLYASGAFDRMFRVRGDTRQVNARNGRTQFYDNGAGGDFRSMTISAGIKGRF